MINPRYKLLKIINNEIISKLILHKFDNIMTIIFVTPVLQHIDNHNLISSTDKNRFVCLIVLIQIKHYNKMMKNIIL